MLVLTKKYADISHGGRGGFFVTCEDYGRRFNESFLLGFVVVSRGQLARIVPTVVGASATRAELIMERVPERVAYELGSLTVSLAPQLDSMVAELGECCFTSTETVGLLGTGAQDGHLDFHTAPELCVVAA